MNAVTFDTHAFVKRLKESGFEETKAEALSEVIKDSQEARLEELATKLDIQELASATKQDIQELASATKQDIQGLASATKQDIQGLAHKIRELEQRIDIKFESVKGEIRLLKWMIGVLLAGVISLVMKAFFI